MLACPSQKQTQITLEIHKSLVEGEAFDEPVCHSTAASLFPASSFHPHLSLSLVGVGGGPQQVSVIFFWLLSKNLWLALIV